MEISFFSIITTLWHVIIGLLGIGFLIGFHELGHFLFCKLFNIHTPTFSIGIMGPTLFKKKIGTTEFIVTALPVGGYVEVAGANEGPETPSVPPSENTINRKPYYQKMLVLSGGILFNLFFAYAAFSALFFWGAPAFPLIYNLAATTTIDTVLPDTPAAQAGIQSKDTILAVNNESVQNNPERLLQIIRSNPNKKLSLTIKRDDTEITLPITPSIPEAIKSETSNLGYIGAQFHIPRYGIIESIKKGIRATHLIVYSIFDGFKRLIMRDPSQKAQFGGPILLLASVIKGAQQGIKIFLLFLAFISVNLAVINLVPLPIMDGGQALFYTIEAIMKRPVSPKIREYIFIGCWILVLILFVYLSIKDVLFLTFSTN